MYSSALILLSFALFVIANAEVSSKNRILKGKNARIADFPYQVSLRSAFGADHFCGGTIIGERHILTAAHCLYGKRPNFSVHTGTSYRLQRGKAHRVASFKIHPGFVMDIEQSVPNDIAIITLSKPIEFDQYQRPIELPIRDVENEVTANITGWGRMYDAIDVSPNPLQKLEVKVFKAETCQPRQNLPVLDTQVCTLTERGAGVCFGDSGGPLAANGEIIGIVSWSEADNCGSDYPDVFTKVYSYLDFIKSAMEDN